MGMNALTVGLAWFLRGTHRRRCKNHAKRVLWNEYKEMQGNATFV